MTIDNVVTLLIVVIPLITELVKLYGNKKKKGKTGKKGILETKNESVKIVFSIEKNNQSKKN